MEGHGGEAYSAGRIRGRFGVAWRNEESAFDWPLILFCPADDGAARQAMTDEDEVFGRKRGGDFVDGMEPVRKVGCFPIVLVYPCIAVECFPAGLPMAGTGIIEARKYEAAGW